MTLLLRLGVLMQTGTARQTLIPTGSDRVPLRILPAVLGLAAGLSAGAAWADEEPRREKPVEAVSSPSMVAGYIENAWFDQNKIAFPAKLDTGANSSSINAPGYKPFKRDGKDWVRIDINNRGGQQLVLEVPIDRYVTIRRAGTAKSERPIVKLTICVGGKIANTEFTLADRTGQSYQVLIGRKFMAGRMLVDSGAEYLVKGRCRAGADR